LKSGECLKTLEGHSSYVNSVAICDDVIVSGSSDKTVKVWSLKSGECLKTLEGHSNWVLSVAIFDDVIVSKSRNETICWSRSSLNRLEDEQVPNRNASLSRALWVVHGNKIRHPEVEVGFTMDAGNMSWEASSTRIACFDRRHVLNLLEIVKQ
jgi:WD40 repeat protein